MERRRVVTTKVPRIWLRADVQFSLGGMNLHVNIRVHVCSNSLSEKHGDLTVIEVQEKNKVQKPWKVGPTSMKGAIGTPLPREPECQGS